jgi:hypothetical protein
VGAGELRLLAVFRLENISNVDEELLVALLVVLAYKLNAWHGHQKNNK